MLKKRGQITIFMIIAFLLLILGFSFFYFNNPDLFPEYLRMNKFYEESKTVQKYYNSCFSNAKIEEVKILPIASINYPLDQQISADLSQQARICLSGLRSFDRFGLNISYTKLSYKIIETEPLVIEFYFPLEISKMGSYIKIDSSRQTYPIRIKTLSKAINTIFEEISANPDNIPIIFNFPKTPEIKVKGAESKIIITGSNINYVVTYKISDNYLKKEYNIPILHKSFIKV